MWLSKGASRRRHERAAVQQAVKDVANEAQEVTEKKPSVGALWADSFGVFATRAVQTIVIVTLLFGLIFGLHALTMVVIPVLLALIFASAFAPVMRWMRGKGVPSLLATLIVLAVVVCVFGMVGWLMVWAVKEESDQLVDQATEGWEQVMAWVQDLPFAPTDQQIKDFQDTVMDFVTSASFGSGALAGVGAVTSFITSLVLMVVILFFFLKDGPQIWLFLIRPFRGSQRERAHRVGDKAVSTLGSYVRGTATVAAVDAVGIGIGLAIVGVPLALPLGVLVFFLSFIPLVGATLAGILAALVALVSNGLVDALIVVAIVIGVNQLEGNFLQPVLMGRTLKLHPLVILVALTIGTLLGRVLGAVLSVPITAVAWGVIQVWDGSDKPANWARKQPEEEQEFK
ncbi:MAG: AI-2E family transporter [Microbacteriaceae bacterium]